MKNLKFNTKKIGCLIMLSASLVLANSCSRKDDTDKKKIIEVLSETKNTTYFDEIIGENRLNDIYLIEQHLEISEELHNLKFERINNINLDEENLLNPDEIRGKMYLYNKKYELSNKELLELRRVLTVQEKLVNTNIYNSYSTMEMATLIGLKTELLTVKGLDITEYDMMTIPNGKTSRFNEGESSYLYLNEYKVDRNLGIGKLLVSIYEMQQKGITTNPRKSNEDAYNPDRNACIRNAILNLKTVLRENYKPNRKNILKKVK